MIDTFAKALSDVLQALGYPDKGLLEVEDAARALRDRLALRGLQLTHSGERLNVKRSAAFTPAQTQREKDLTGVVQGVPLWLERREGAAPYETWRYIPATNLSTVEEARERGDERCAFFKESGRWRVKLSDTPDGSTQYRAVYAPNMLDVGAVRDSLPVPEEFAVLAINEAALDLVPAVLRKLSSDRDNPPARELLAAWEATVAGLNRIITDWMPLWNQRRLRGAGASRGRNRRSVLPR